MHTSNRLPYTFSTCCQRQGGNRRAHESHVESQHTQLWSRSCDCLLAAGSRKTENRMQEEQQRCCGSGGLLKRGWRGHAGRVARSYNRVGKTKGKKRKIAIKTPVLHVRVHFAWSSLSIFASNCDASVDHVESAIDLKQFPVPSNSSAHDGKGVLKLHVAPCISITSESSSSPSPTLFVKA